MSATGNVIKGNQLVFLIRNALDTAYEIAGGVQVRGYNVSNPVDKITSSSTTTDFEESEFTGYGTVAMNVSGVSDKRTGVDAITGLNIVSSARLLEISTTGNRCEKFKMLNVDTNGFIEGVFTVSNYSSNGETPGLKKWEASLDSAADIIFNGEV
mgnify:CR=1 FL=1